MPDTLLLADDSATIQRVIEMTFADEDVRVVAVGDGREAIERIAADPPDIVLADTNMPEQDGYDVSAFVKADRALSHIPVVLLAGAFEPVDGERAREVGCDAVLVKPLEPKVVVSRVRELLGAPAATAAGVPEQAAAAVSAVPEQAAATVTAVPEQAAATVSAVPEQAAAVGDGGPESAGAAAEPESAAPAVPLPADAPPAAGSDPPAAENARPAVADAVPAGEDASPAADAAPPAVAGADAPASPTLADAFASLLAVEQGDLDRARTAYPWPAAPACDDDLVERVAERVVERLSVEVTDELVSEVVARVAERLVRDQIARVKPD